MKKAVTDSFEETVATRAVLAGLALSGILANPTHNHYTPEVERDTARRALAYADALLRELEGKA